METKRKTYDEIQDEMCTCLQDFVKLDDSIFLTIDDIYGDRGEKISEAIIEKVNEAREMYVKIYNEIMIEVLSEKIARYEEKYGYEDED